MLIKCRAVLLSMALLGQVLFSTVSVAATPEVSAGYAHVLALHSDGRVLSWGTGVLSNGTPLYEKNPTPMPVVDASGNPLVDAIDIAVGEGHSMALKANGSLLTWGVNNFGVVGNGGSSVTVYEPVEVLTGVRAIAASYFQSMALKTDGTVWAWGRNDYGQLGIGTETLQETSPVRVGSLTDVTALAGSAYNGYALKSDGTVWAWGRNGGGQIGDGTLVDRITPVQVSNLAGVTAIAAGGAVAYALKSDGTVWAWGSNIYGKLGNGSTSGGYSTTPTQVINLAGITNISSFNNHVLAVRSDSTVWGWGNSVYDELGDAGGGQGTVATPVQITGLTGNESRVEAGLIFSFALSCDGSLRGWGNNDSGQLGDGTVTSTATPVQTIGINGVGNLDLGNTCPPPPPSDDHGNSTETATEINVDSSTAGSLEVGGDVDYFKFVIGSDTTVTLQATGSTDTHGTLLDASANVLVADDDSGAGGNFLITMPLTPGTYYVVVKGYNTSTTGDYTLVSESSGVPPPPSDDHGNSTETATEISVDSSTPGSLEVGGDVDYFKFVIDTDTTVFLQTIGSIDTYGTLLDWSGNVLGLDSNIIATTLTPGTYYVVVQAYDGSTTGDYTLLFDSTGNGDDHGNTTDTATMIDVGIYVHGVIDYSGDVDVFKFDNFSETTLTLKTEGFTDTYGTLLDWSGNVLAHNDDDGLDSNFLITATLLPGPYYVVVESFGWTGPYKLIVEDQDPGPESLASAVLPGSRSVQVGSTASAFTTVINTGNELATNCSIAPVTTVPATFSYQTTDPATNALIGSPDTPVDIPAGAYQTYLFAFTPTAAFAPTEVELSYDCNNTAPAPTTLGVNTLLLSGSATPVADIVAMAATPTADGIVNIPGVSGANAFVVATANVGASGTITASADIGGTSLPVTLFICETNPSTGACLDIPAASVTTTIAGGATPTFAIFVNGSGTVPFDPANNRIFVRFKDAGSLTRGATSVAVRTQ